MTEDAKMEKLLHTIRALKAKANDPGTTEAESLAFAAKVAELLAKHDLEEAQLEVENEELHPIGHEDHVSNWNASPARRLLVIAICRLYNVSPLIREKKGQPWTLVGRKTNIIMVKDMAEYLIKTTLRLSNAWVRQNQFGNAVDFRRGCFKRLSERLNEMREAMIQKETPVFNNGNPGNLPALFLNERRLQSAYIDAHWRTKAMRSINIKQGHSAMAGREAGNNISLNRQINSGSRGGNMMLEHKK